MKHKLPIWKRTFEFFKRLGNSEKYTFGKIAKNCGNEMQTAEAWGREPQCDEFPFGSGKRNPSDMQIRLIGMAYDDDPGFAREWAMMFPAYVDYLDELHGRRHRQAGGCAMDILAASFGEHADILKALVNREAGAEEVWQELLQFKAIMNQFEACLKQEVGEGYGFPETKAVPEVSGRMN